MSWVRRSIITSRVPCAEGGRDQQTENRVEGHVACPSLCGAFTVLQCYTQLSVCKSGLERSAEGVKQSVGTAEAERQSHERPKLAAAAPEDDEEVDATGVEAKDIELVMTQVGAPAAVWRRGQGPLHHIVS